MAAVASFALIATATAAYAWWGTYRGVARAIIDHARGTPGIYRLGCVNAPPRDPKQFRIQEILERDYHMHFEVIGGYAPSSEQVEFSDAYDRVSIWLLLRRYGRDFPQRVERRAAADVAAGLPNSEWRKWYGPPSGSPK